MSGTAFPIASLKTQFSGGGTPPTIFPINEQNFIATLQTRTPTFRSTDPEYGAVGDGTSRPISGIAAFSTATSPASLAAIVVGGATPYSWATTAAYGLTFTKTTSASTTSGTTLTLGSLSGDVTKPMQFLVVGMSVTGTNIPANTVISSIAFTSGTPNKIDGPLAGTVVINNAVTGTVSSGATLTFAYTSTMIQALQVDWLGIQAAEFAAEQNGTFGGHHVTPAGLYVMSRPILRNVGAGFANQSMWTGDGMGPTCLQWFTDLGPGVWVVAPGSRDPFGNIGYGDIRDMFLIGPGVGSTMGASTCKMHGLALGTRDYCSRVMVQGFYSGFNIVGDHQKAISCFGNNNYFGVYFAPYAAGTKGDQAFIDCDFSGNTMASFGVSGTNEIGYALIQRCHTGFGPYGFYKETGADTNFVINSILQRLSIEAVGNGAFYDENAAGLFAGNMAWMDVALDTTGTTYYYSGNTVFGMFYFGNIQNCEFRGEVDPYTAGYNRATHPLTTGIIVCQQGCSRTKFFQATNLILTGTTTFPAVVTGTPIIGPDVRWDSGMAAGTFRSSFTSVVTAGKFVAQGAVGIATNPSSNLGIIGMAIYGASGSITTAAVAVQDYGYTVQPIKHTTADTWAAGAWLQVFSSSDGTVVAFNSGARTCTVGRSWFASAGTDTTAYMEIDIKGP